MQDYRVPSENKPDKVRRGLWAAFIFSALLTIILAFCSRKDNTEPVPIFSPGYTGFTLSPEEGNLPTQDDGRSLQTNADRPEFKKLDLDQTTYFLLIGLDRRDWEEDGGPGLTDTIMVAYLDKTREKAGLLSIPRDTWVDVPNYGPYKINQAFSLGEAYGYPGGGPGILMDTAGNLLGIEIDYYIQVDFEAFVVLVDAVNGVPVYVEEEILVWPNAKMEGDMKRVLPGKHVFPGNIALGYVRTRDTLEGDFGRNKRQQQVLVGLQKKIFSQEILPVLVPRLPGLYRDLSSNVETNLTLSQIVSLAWAVKDINPQSVQSRVIREPIVTAGINDRDQYVLVPDLDLVRKIWQDMQEISATPIPEPTQQVSQEEQLEEENATVAVLNATASSGLATLTAEYLVASGIPVGEVGNSDKFKEQTYIYDYTGNPHTVEAILAAMDYNQTKLFFRSDPSITADIIIVLGTDWVQDNPMDEMD